MAQQSPLVSVLVPICNVENYLVECLESLRVQTLTDIEVICINDGSTDGSLDIINSFVEKDARFKVIDKPNSGYGDSMNKGLELAQGKYISILESDDFVEPEALEYMAGRCESEDLEVLKCDFWLYWSKPGADQLHRHNLYYPALPAELVSLGTFAGAELPQIFWAKPSIWSALYRKDFLDANNIRFLPTPGASFQDTSFSFKVFACATRMACSSRAFLHYRQDNEKSSVNNPGKVFCVCDEHQEIARFLSEDRPDLKQGLDPIRAKMKFFNYNWNLNRLADELKPQFLERYAVELREEFEAGNVIHAEGDFGWLSFDANDYGCAREIAYDTKFYGARIMSHGSKVETLKNYYRAGSLGFVLRVIKEKLSR